MFFKCLPVAAGLALTATGLMAQQSRPNLSGNWKLVLDKSEVHAAGAGGMTIKIEQKGDAIHVTKLFTDKEGKETKVEFACSTNGKECEANGIKTSLWYNGSTLVEMDIDKEIVTQSSMKLASDGKSLNIDVSHIAPEGDPDKLLLQPM